MSRIKHDDIIAFENPIGIYCPECWKSIGEKITVDVNFILKDQTEDGTIITCDECGVGIVE